MANPVTGGKQILKRAADQKKGKAEELKGSGTAPKAAAYKKKSKVKKLAK